jgi:hypothetical protein
LLSAGGLLACPWCGAIFKIDLAKGIAVGFVAGFVVFPLMLIPFVGASFESFMSNIGAAAVIYVPLGLAFLVARLLPSLSLEEPPPDPEQWSRRP